MPKVFKIEADDVIHYHKTYYVEAETQAEAKSKLKSGEWFDSETSSERGESTFEKIIIRSFDSLKVQKILIGVADIPQFFRNRKEK